MSSKPPSQPSSSRKSMDASMFDPPTAAELAALDRDGVGAASDAENDATTSGRTRGASGAGDGAASERDDADATSSHAGDLDRELLTKAVLRRGLADIQRAGDGGYAFTRLDLSGQAIKSLEGDLPSYPDLKYVNLSSNELMDLSPLSALPTLLSLNASYNHLGSLETFLSCRHEQLQLLQADHNDIEYLFSRGGGGASSVGAAAAGSKRSSGANASASIDPLTSLSTHTPSLFALTLSNNKLVSLVRREDSSPSTLASLSRAPHPSLQILDLAFNQLADLSGLQAFPHLRVLNVQSNALETLQGVEALVCLEKLNVSENKLARLAPELARLASLSHLSHLVLTAGNGALQEELESALAAAQEAGTASEAALAHGVDMQSEILIVLPRLLFLDGKRVTAAQRARADALQKERIADAERRKAEEEELRKQEEAEQKAAKEAEEEEEKDSDEEKDEDAEADPDAEHEPEEQHEHDAEPSADFDGGDGDGDADADADGAQFDDAPAEDGGDDDAGESFDDDGAAEEEEQ